MAKKNANKSEKIGIGKALDTFEGKSKASRALDATKRSRKVMTRPTKGWAKDPSTADVRGIDDGSKVAKDRNRQVIHDYFSKLGKKGVKAKQAKKPKKAKKAKKGKK